MGADCKSAGYAYVGSNPTRPIRINCPCSSAVERTLGKGEVMSSILIMGFLGRFLSFTRSFNVWGLVKHQSIGCSGALINLVPLNLGWQ
jgi:hypothetical protein